MSFINRVFRRFQTESIPLSLRPVGSFAWSEGTILNISKGGLRIHTPARLLKDQKLDLEFNTKDASGVSTRRRLIGTVMWVKVHHVGIRFER